MPPGWLAMSAPARTVALRLRAFPDPGPRPGFVGWAAAANGASEERRDEAVRMKARMPTPARSLDRRAIGRPAWPRRDRRRREREPAAGAPRREYTGSLHPARSADKCPC